MKCNAALILFSALFLAVLSCCQSSNRRKATTPPVEEKPADPTPDPTADTASNPEAPEAPTPESPQPVVDAVDPSDSIGQAGMLNPLAGNSASIGFLQAEDTQFYGPVNGITKDQMLSYLRKQPILYAAVPPEVQANNCFSEKMKTVTFNVEDAQAIASGSLDFSDCLKSTLETSFDTVSAAKSTLTFFVSNICNDQGIKDLANKTFNDTYSSLGACENATFAKQTIQTRWDISYSAAKAANVYNVESVESSILSNKNGGHCLYSKDQGWWKLNFGCMYVHNNRINKYEINGQQRSNVANDYTQIYFGDLLRGSLTDQNPWFVSGQVSVLRNNWSGIIDYQGQTNPPALKLKNHLGEPLSGFLSL